MARRQLLTDEERRLLFGVPRRPGRVGAATTRFTRSDQELVAGRRGDANRLGFAVQLALLRHPGMALAHMEEPVDALVDLAGGAAGDSGRGVRRVRPPAADDDRPRAHARRGARAARRRAPPICRS